MAKIVSFVVSESINNMPAPQMGTVPMVVAPQIALRPQFIPGNFSFGMAVGVAEIDLHIVNKIRFVITAPDGSVVQDSGDNELPIAPKDDTLPAEHQGFMMCIDIRNLAIPCEGKYSFAFYMNGECIGTQMVPVFKRVG